MPKKLTTDEFIEKARKVHGDKYEYILVEYTNNSTIVEIICEEHGEFEQTPNSHLCGRGCPSCGVITRTNKRRKRLDVFISEGNIIHNNYYTYNNVNYISTETKILITCPIHGDFTQTPHNHLNGDGCPVCGEEKRKYKRRKGFNNFVKESNLVHNHYYEYNDNIYVNAHSLISIICPIHGDFTQTPHAHLNGQGCHKCAGFNKTYNDIVLLCNKTHNNIYSYPNIYGNNFIKYNEKIEVICSNKNHGSFFPKLSNHLTNKTGCPKCNSSKGELYVEKILKENNVNYITQQKFKKCKDKRQLPFDFYLPKYNMCIEFDGIQHFKVIEAWGGEEGLKDRQKKDNIKTKYCEENIIKLLRIRYDENIEEKLKENGII